jgi:hypothetical protein
MATFLEGFRRLSSELEISERRLCQEIGMDQSRLSALRKRLNDGQMIQGLQIDIILAIKIKFPQVNMNGFFDSNQKFFSRSTIATESLLDKMKVMEDKLKMQDELLQLYRKNGS